MAMTEFSIDRNGNLGNPLVLSQYGIFRVSTIEAMEGKAWNEVGVFEGTIGDILYEIFDRTGNSYQTMGYDYRLTFSEVVPAKVEPRKPFPLPNDLKVTIYKKVYDDKEIFKWYDEKRAARKE
jgi:hypothetical protein